MVSLIASIAGFAGSFVPEIIKLYRDRNEKKHEISLMEQRLKQNKYSKKKSEGDKDEEERKLLYSTYNSGINWVDSLNSSVRPVLAYAFFAVYIIAKFLQYKTLGESVPSVERLNLIWSLEDQAIFAGIISFYFGQRTFGKILKK